MFHGKSQIWHELGLWKESIDCRRWWNLVSFILWFFMGHFYSQTESLSSRRCTVSNLKNPGGGFSDRTGSSGTHLGHSSVQGSQVCSSDNSIQINTACKYINILHMISYTLWCTKFKSTNHRYSNLISQLHISNILM